MKKEKAQKTEPVLRGEQFGLLPEYQLTKKEKKVLKTIFRAEATDFPSLCRVLDSKPSKLEKKTIALIAKGLLFGAEDGRSYALTPAAVRLLTTEKEDRKMQKKFREFLNSLNEEESKEFCRLCDRFQYTEDDASAEADCAE